MTGTPMLDATNSIVRSDELSVQCDTIDFVGRPSALGEPWSEKQHAKVAFQSPQIDIMTSFFHVETADYGSDQRDMERMGRKVELPRTYGLHSCLGYSIVFSSSWIFALVTGTYNLGNGGLAGSLYMLLFCCFGMMSVMLSVAEITSIIPSSGAQYHWTSEFAPQRCHKFLSFIVGWLTVIGWIAAMILTCFISGQQVQSLIALYHPSYTHEAWHASLLTIAATIVAVTINIFLVRKLAFVEGLVLILYGAGFLFILVVFWVMGDHGPAKDLFTDFESTEGWSSPLLAGLVNIGSPLITLVGADSACHLSEEIKNASWGVPRAMVMTALLSYTAGLIMQVTVLANLGQYATVEGARADPYQTYVSVLLYTTDSRPATTFCIMIILFLILFCAVNQTTTASRQVYAFARDHGMPFSNWLSHVRPGWDYPLNALLATLFCSVTLSLVTMAYRVVHEMLNTLCLSGLLLSYLIFIVVVFWRKLHAPERFREGKFLLGRRLGLAINFIAMLFLTIAILFVYFPAETHPTTSNNNWSILAWLCILPVLTIYYFLHGRKHYTSPVERTRKHE